MLPPVPILNDYGISPEYGFLPAELPLERLPDPYYNKWEAIVANLQGLILSKRLRGVIDLLPILSTAGLEHDSEWRRAYSLLCFMAHGYIWGGDNPTEVCVLFSSSALHTLTLCSVCQPQSRFHCSTYPLT
jgi:indoleamine 2,3-dioxygenase